MKSLERILYCWAIRHPASGYVQGINDLVTPFFQVFLSAYIKEQDVENCVVDAISDEILAMVEADSFWCLSKLLDGIQVCSDRLEFGPVCPKAALGYVLFVIF
jgi:hypothetical protein